VLDYEKILVRLGELKGKKRLYTLLRENVTNMMDDSLPGGKLVIGVSREVAREILDELQEGIDAVEDEKKVLLTPEPEKPAKKKPGPKKKVDMSSVPVKKRGRPKKKPEDPSKSSLTVVSD